MPVALGSTAGAGALGSEQIDAASIYPATRFPFLVGRYDAHEEAVNANLVARTRARLARTRLPVDTFVVAVRSDVARGIRVGDVNVGDTCRFTVDPPSTDYSVDGWYRVVQQRLVGEATGLVDWRLALAPDDASTGMI